MFRSHRHAILRLFFSVAVLCAPLHLSFVARAQTKTPISHETMWQLKRVGAPAPSPDGKWVVFSLIEPAYDEKDQVSDLWIVPADGSAKPRRLTFTKSGESGVSWSPDSNRLAFSAKREGDEIAQIYIIDVVDGGRVYFDPYFPVGYLRNRCLFQDQIARSTVGMQSYRFHRFDF